MKRALFWLAVLAGCAGPAPETAQGLRDTGALIGAVDLPAYVLGRAK